MPPKATEGVASRGAPAPFSVEAVEATPSGLPAISPLKEEIPASPLSPISYEGATYNLPGN
ncbi:hypothetical protein ABID26_000535 [Mesorhizobium shonense]|uniref:Uncharacterized protein n=1 Tax=Mesorhizobium shonense TaxID=1209948 RepID=A0ABV2HKR7_9HYPH